MKEVRRDREDTQEMKIKFKKRKINHGSPFYVKMEPFKMKNKKFKKSGTIKY